MSANDRDATQEIRSVHFIVVTSPKINHYVLVPGVRGVSAHVLGVPRKDSPVEEHDRA